MLTRQLDQARRNPALILIVLGGGVVLGALIGVVFTHGGGSAHAADSGAGAGRTTRAPTRHAGVIATPAIVPRALASATAKAGAAAVSSTHAAGRSQLQVALNYGVTHADALGGEAAAAVWVSGDPQPVLSGPTTVPHRMWSISKAVATIAALQATHEEPDPVLQAAIADAIRRSDNCAIRRVIVGLQDRLDEGVAGTVAAFERVLGSAGVVLARTPQAAAAEQACVHYLETHQGGLPGSDLGVVPQFGTAEWTEDDAILFTHALAQGVYGAAGRYLLRLMGMPKQPPLEEPPPPSAPPLDWGAGAVFQAAWQPAWKAGWGGSQDVPPRFLAAQIVVLHIAGVPVAVSAIFRPKAEPPSDNPGITEAPQALQLMFAAAQIGLEDERVGAGG